MVTSTATVGTWFIMRLFASWAGLHTLSAVQVLYLDIDGFRLLVMKRALFLDFDGVLNHNKLFSMIEHSEPTPLELEQADELVSLYNHDYPRHMIVHDLRSVDPECVKHLNEIIEKSDAEVVVSSSWRFIHTIPALQKILEFQGLKGEIIDITPIDVRGKNVLRGDEIQAWLHLNLEYDQFCILDDDTDMCHLSDHLIRTDRAVGLTAEDAQRALSIITVGPVGV